MARRPAPPYAGAFPTVRRTTACEVAPCLRPPSRPRARQAAPSSPTWSRTCPASRSRSSTSAASSTRPSRTGTAAPEGETVRWALMYPDAYEVGLPNQGVQILYEVLNERDWIVAERTYAVWPDMEAVLREHDIPQFTVDAHRPVGDFDVLGLSFSTELGYTNMLNALDLAGIPLHAVDRGEHDPVVLAGGHAAFNPEPIADFVDAAVLGDGEEVVLAISEVVREWKAEGRPGGRDELLRRLAVTGNVYVPKFYDVVVRRGRLHRGVVPNKPGVPFRVKKHTLMDLDAWPYPRQAAGAAGRDRARALQRRDLPRLHPRLPLLPGRDDHPPGARALDRDHRRHGRERHPLRPASRRSGCSRSPAPTTPRSATSPRAWPTATRAPTSRSRCPRPASTPSTSPWPTSSPATAGARG